MVAVGPAIEVGERQPVIDWRRSCSDRAKGLVGALTGFVWVWQEGVSRVWVLRVIVVCDGAVVAFGCSRKRG